jgi:hypothetical protein
MQNTTKAVLEGYPDTDVTAFSRVRYTRRQP